MRPTKTWQAGWPQWTSHTTQASSHLDFSNTAHSLGSSAPCRYTKCQSLHIRTLRGESLGICKGGWVHLRAWASLPFNATSWSYPSAAWMSSWWATWGRCCNAGWQAQPIASRPGHVGYCGHLLQWESMNSSACKEDRCFHQGRQEATSYCQNTFHWPPDNNSRLDERRPGATQKLLPQLSMLVLTSATSKQIVLLELTVPRGGMQRVQANSPVRRPLKQQKFLPGCCGSEGEARVWSPPAGSPGWKCVMFERLETLKNSRKHHWWCFQVASSHQTSWMVMIWFHLVQPLGWEVTPFMEVLTMHYCWHSQEITAMLTSPYIWRRIDQRKRLYPSPGVMSLVSWCVSPKWLLFCPPQHQAVQKGGFHTV